MEWCGISPLTSTLKCNTERKKSCGGVKGQYAGFDKDTVPGKGSSIYVRASESTDIIS